MIITVNGKGHQVVEGTCLHALLEQLKVNRQYVAVEVNTQLVVREHYAERTLVDGDTVEIVTLVGGG